MTTQWHGKQRTRWRLPTLVGACLFTASTALVGGSVAIADDGDSADAALSAIQAVAPSVLSHVDSVATTDQGDSAIDATVAGTAVTVPTDPSDGISLQGASATDPITVGLPFAASADSAEVARSGVVTHDNGNGSTTVPVVQSDGSVQINTVIDSSSSPSRYVYPVAVPSGGSLSLDSTDGSVSVLDASGSYQGGFAPAWAKDATGAAVPTHFEIEGTNLVQVVDLSSSSIAYPVVADPWIGINLIDHVNWVTYSKWSPTLAITPTWYGRYGPAAAGWAAWDEVVKKGGSRANTNTMNVQFFCHWDAVRLYKPNKPTWDLDSKRPDTSLVNEIRYKCNYPDGGTEW